MSRELSVHFLPNLFAPADLRGGVAVVIDLLRASTTIVQALAAGAQAVIPCVQVDEARRIAANLLGTDVLLGGERAGTLIDGFDLDNSPLSYTPAAVAGKTIVFTTTNGTGALLQAAEADRILVGALTNLDALVRQLAAEARPIHLVCAGTRGEITSEDILCAGAIAAGLREASETEFNADDQTEIAIRYFTAHAGSRESLEQAIQAGRGGRDLLELGYEADIGRAAECNLYQVIPEFFSESGRIELLRSHEDIQELERSH